jgi:iron complex outermembrane receptor protein
VDFAAIPISNIERIEIVRSGGSVLYGDGASGGSINIITKPRGTTGTSGSVQAGFGSFNSREAGLSLTHTTEQLFLNIAANRIRSDGYRDNNELRQSNLQADLRFTHDDGELFLQFGGDEQKLRLPGPRTVDPTISLDELDDDPTGTNTPNDYADQRGHFFTTGFSHYLSDSVELIVDAGYRKKNQKAFFDYGFGFSDYLDTDLATWSITPRLRIAYGSEGDSLLTLGLDYYDSQYDSDRKQTKSSAPIHQLDISQSSLALYAHSSNALSADTTLTAGARRQWIDLRARDQYDPTAPGAWGSEAPDYDNSEHENMFELGLRHQLNSNLSLFGRYERSVRFATVDELYESNSFSHLEPQTVNHIDLGAEYRNAGMLLKGTLYAMRLKNEIHYSPAAGAWGENINLDPTKRYGAELSSKFELTKDIALKANYARTISRFRDGVYDGNDVPMVPGHTASLGVEARIMPNLLFAATSSYVGSKRFDNDQENTLHKIPSYWFTDLMLKGSFKGWELSARANNIFDEEAYDYGIKSTATPGRYNAYPLPERNYSIDLTYSW